MFIDIRIISQLNNYKMQVKVLNVYLVYVMQLLHKY
jgi:hypothetical protein